MLRRLRVLAVVVAAVVLIVAIGQIVILAFLTSTANQASDLVNRSGLRRADVLLTLYEAKRVEDGAPRRALDGAVSDLEARQRQFSDLSIPERARLYNSFIAAARTFSAHPHSSAVLAALGTEGVRLEQLYGALTQEYGRASEAGRGRFRVAAIVGSVTIVIASIMLYALVVVPNEREVRRLIEDLSDSEERFRSVLDAHSEAVVVLARDATILRVNHSMEMLSGYEASELIGFAPAKLAVPEFLPVIRRNLVRVADEGISVHHESALIRKDGERREMSVDLIPMFTRGSVTSVCVFLHDVSVLRESQRREREQRDRLRAISLLAAAHASNVDEQIEATLAFAVRSLGVDVATVGLQEGEYWRITHAHESPIAVGERYIVAESFSRHIFGSHDVLVVDDVDVEPWKSDPASHQRWKTAIITSIFAGEEPIGVVSLASRNVRARPFDDADKDFVRVVAALIGASIERERVEQRLREMAFIDPLTRLANRARLAESLHLAMARIDRHQGHVCVLYLDLDGFKAVNDRLGHEAGDAVLREVAERLRATVRKTDVLARIGGDEFVVIDEAAEGEGERSTLLAERITEEIAKPIPIDEETIHIGVSIGIARYPGDGKSVGELLRHADAAMYQAKHAGRGRARTYQGLASPPDLSEIS